LRLPFGLRAPGIQAPRTCGNPSSSICDILCEEQARAAVYHRIVAVPLDAWAGYPSSGVRKRDFGK
jgi:hypothetical protein